MEDLKSAGSPFATKYAGKTIYESRYQCSASKGSFHGFLFIVRQWKGKIQVIYSCLYNNNLKTYFRLCLQIDLASFYEFYGCLLCTRLVTQICTDRRCKSKI